MSIDMRVELLWGIDAESMHAAFNAWRSSEYEIHSLWDLNWQDYYAHKCGISCGEEGPTDADYMSRRDEAVAASGCCIGEHGYLSSESLFYAAISASMKKHSGPWGFRQFEPVFVQPDWNTRIKQFCEVMGISWSEPRWRLTACYY